MDFQCCKNTLFLLQEENYRSTCFICVHWWEVLFPKIQKNSKEIDLGMTSEAFPAAHISNAPCVALPLGDFSVVLSFSVLGVSPFSLSYIFVSSFCFVLIETTPSKHMSKFPSSLVFSSDSCIYTC